MTSLSKREQKLSDIIVFILVFIGVGFFIYKTVIAVNQPPLVTSLGPTELRDGSSSINTKPVFSFSVEDDSETVQYEIQITTSEDSSYDSPVVDFVSDLIPPGDDITYQVGNAAEGSGYYVIGDDVGTLPTGAYIWRVKATDIEGLDGGYTLSNDEEDAGFRVNFPNRPQDLGPEEYTKAYETLNTNPQFTFKINTRVDGGQLKYSFTLSRNAEFTDNPIIFVSALMDPGTVTYTVGQNVEGGTYRRGTAGQELENGHYFWRVSTLDASGNESGFTYANNRDEAFTVVSELADEDAPIISDQNVEVSQDEAIIRWQTNKDASSVVLFDTNENLNYNAQNDDLSTSHSITLAGLVPCVTYLYQIQSIDAGNHRAALEPDAFTTTGCPGGAAITDRIQASLDTGGGEISLKTDGKGIRLQAPAAFASSSHDFQIVKLEKTAALSALSRPTGKTEVGDYIYDLHALADPLNATRIFDEPLVITISYANMDIDGLDERTFKIYRNDDDVWTLLSGCTVNTDDKEVTCTTDHFSTFSLFGQPASTSSGGGSHGGVAIIPSTTNASSSSTATSTSTNTQTNIPDALSPSQFLFLKNLGFGSTDNDVQKLQSYLNTHGFPVSTNGAGSNGKETTYFGMRTRNALIKFQEAYKESILKPFGLETGTGIFGKKSREYINSHQ